MTYQTCQTQNVVHLISPRLDVLCEYAKADKSDCGDGEDEVANDDLISLGIRWESFRHDKYELPLGLYGSE